jgi:hypothetical protein
METIKITVENGCVIDVENLPKNYNYEIIDHDVIDYEPLPQKMEQSQ